MLVWLQAGQRFLAVFRSFPEPQFAETTLTASGYNHCLPAHAAHPSSLHPSLVPLTVCPAAYQCLKYSCNRLLSMRLIKSMGLSHIESGSSTVELQEHRVNFASPNGMPQSNQSSFTQPPMPDSRAVREAARRPLPGSPPAEQIMPLRGAPVLLSKKFVFPSSYVAAAPGLMSCAQYDCMPGWFLLYGRIGHIQPQNEALRHPQH